MLVKQLLKIEGNSDDDTYFERQDTVDAADKTKLYMTLDNMLDYLHVYRGNLKGSRIPFFQTKFLERQ